MGEEGARPRAGPPPPLLAAGAPGGHDLTHSAGRRDVVRRHEAEVGVTRDAWSLTCVEVVPLSMLSLFFSV